MSSASPQEAMETQIDENSSFSEDTTQAREDKQAGLTESSHEAKSNAQGSSEEDTDSPNTNEDDYYNIEDDEEREMLISKGWKLTDDQTLLGLATKYKCDWKKISKKFDNKKFTPYFLKIRYKELIDAPVQKKHKFTQAEDLLLAKLFKSLGSNWNEIAKHFKNRTGVMLKNRYYSYIRKRGLLDELVSKAESQPHHDSQTTINRIVQQVMEEIQVQETFIEKKEEVKVVDFNEISFSQTFYEFEGVNDSDGLHTKVTPMNFDESSFDYAGHYSRQNIQNHMNYGYNYSQQQNGYSGYYY